ncbi:MAG: hypothetical protein ACJAT4_003014 [Granulosicoccus sp.]|jgi:hypothetical protein
MSNILLCDTTITTNKRKSARVGFKSTYGLKEAVIGLLILIPIYQFANPPFPLRNANKIDSEFSVA